MKLVACAVALFVSVAVSATSVAAEDTYKVSLEVREAGEVVSAPVTFVRADADASVSKDGEDWFSLEFSVSPTVSGSVEFNAVYESATGKLAPMMELELGKTATLGAGDVELTVTVEPAEA